MTDPSDRAAFREFVRTSHPDRGGDPDVFMAGLAACRRGAVASPRPGSNLVFHRRRRGLGLLRGWWSGRRAGGQRPTRVT